MIEIKNLTKKYGTQTIFESVNRCFPDNGLICLLGASGCGKSTLLNLLAGFDSDYSGEITVCGASISQMNAEKLCAYRRDNIGFVFQNYNLLTGYTVLENVLIACELNSDNDTQNKENAKQLLEKLGLSEKVNEKIENLSGGQKQRVAIARALINNPSIILADEPTGALDRKNSTEIMELLKEISNNCLVLVITHDQKICEFADNTLTMEDQTIVGEETVNVLSKQKIKESTSVKTSAFAHGLKNFKVHLKRYVAVSLAISIGVLAFMLSLSSSNIMQQSILEFQEKNTAFNNGYIKVENNSNEILSLLKEDSRVENIYEQYIIQNVSIAINNETESMEEKYPMSKATKSMSYGVMPKAGKQEIALSPSLARKFGDEINKLIGKECLISYGGKEYKLTVSGIFNAEYDDFFVSSDIENEFYTSVSKENLYSVSYDVKKFEDIVSVTQILEEKNIKPETAAKEVGTLQNTFENLQRLFFVVSLLILAIGLFISVILLVKLQNSRYREIGLLSALGFSKGTIRAMIINENLLLSVLAAAFNALLIGAFYLITKLITFNLIVSIPQIVFSILGTGIVVVLISIIASYKLINTEPAVALRK